MIAAKQLRHRLVEDKSKQVYSDNTDKKRVRRPMLTGKADLQVAAFTSLLDLRFNAESKEYEILVRTVQEDGEVARSWVKASALDFEDDEEGENKLLKLLNLYEQLTSKILKQSPHLTPFYDHKLRLLSVLREEMYSREAAKQLATPAPVKTETSHEFMKKYGGQINNFADYDAKKKLFREFVLEYCHNKLNDVESRFNQEYTHLDFSKMISYIRRTFELKYREKVIQKLRQETHR